MAESKKKLTTGKRLDTLEDQFSTLTQTVESFGDKLNTLVDILKEQHTKNEIASTPVPTAPQSQGITSWPPPEVQQKRVVQPTNFSGEYRWLRLKPENKKRGVSRRSTKVPELSMVIRGGSGQPGDIPVWYAIPVELVPALQEYTQDDDDPMSPPLFDIVTEEEKHQIDEKEESYRRAKLGVGPHQQGPVQGLKAPSEAAKLAPNTPTPAQQAIRSQPTTMPGAEDFTARSKQISGQVASHIVENSPPTQPMRPQGFNNPNSGRAAALEGLDPQAPAGDADSDGGEIQGRIMDLSQVPISPEMREIMTDAANMKQQSDAEGGLQVAITGKD